MGRGAGGDSGDLEALLRPNQAPPPAPSPYQRTSPLPFESTPASVEDLTQAITQTQELVDELTMWDVIDNWYEKARWDDTDLPDYLPPRVAKKVLSEGSKGRAHRWYLDSDQNVKVGVSAHQRLGMVWTLYSKPRDHTGVGRQRDGGRFEMFETLGELLYHCQRRGFDHRLSLAQAENNLQIEETHPQGLSEEDAREWRSERSRAFSKDWRASEERSPTGPFVEGAEEWMREEMDRRREREEETGEPRSWAPFDF